MTQSIQFRDIKKKPALCEVRAFSYKSYTYQPAPALMVPVIIIMVVVMLIMLNMCIVDLLKILHYFTFTGTRIQSQPRFIG